MADQMTLNPAALRNLADILVRYCHVQNALLDQYLSDIYGLSDEWRDDETFSLMVEAIRLLSQQSKQYFDELCTTYPPLFNKMADYIDSRPIFDGSGSAAASYGASSGISSGHASGTNTDLSGKTPGRSVGTRFDALRGRQLSALNDQERKELINIAVDNMIEKYGDVVSLDRFDRIREQITFVDNDTVAKDFNKSPARASYILGYYNPASDSIKINQGAEDRVDNILATLDHEAMHMATEKLDGSYITGVLTRDPHVPLGNVGMNEGLTEMYSIRNVQTLCPAYISRSYTANVEIMENFESVYGSEKLKEAYLTNDFSGLRSNFDAVMGRGQFHKFCKLFDSMHNNFSEEMHFLAEHKKQKLLKMVAQYERKVKECEL